MKDRYIIFGGAGFIGSHLAETLVEKDLEIILFDKKNASKRNVEHLLSGVEFIEGDFNNEMDLKESLNNIDYVVHLVSSTLPADSNLNPVYDIESNLLSSINLFEECAKQKVKKIIFISSGGTVYGNPVAIPIREDHPTNPTCSYGITKLAIEKYLYLYKTLRGTNFKILRFSNPFGERQNPLSGQGLIANFLYKIKNKSKIEVWGDGNIIRDYFYVKDAVRAVYLASKNESEETIFNVGAGIGYSINQILDKFRSVLNLDFEVEYSQQRSFDVQANILDSTRALEVLDWRPETGFDEALRKTWSFISNEE